MYALHITNRNYSSWSLRPWLLLRELGIPFREHLHPWTQPEDRESFRQFSPSGTVPCLVDGDLTVWDSLAIVEYLAERHAGVWPSAADARAWARCAAAEMHAGFHALRSNCSMSCGVRIRLHGISPALRRDIRRIEELWSDGLRRFGGPFLAGSSFSAADAFFAPISFRVQTYGLPLGATASAYAARLLELPGMQEWYAAAIAEPWREPAHEAEIARAGIVLRDDRARSGTAPAT